MDQKIKQVIAIFLMKNRFFLYNISSPQFLHAPIPSTRPPTSLLFKIHFPFPLLKRIGLQERTANKTKQDMIKTGKSAHFGAGQGNPEGKRVGGTVAHT